MIKWSHGIVIFAGLILLLTACEKWNLDQQNFIQLSITQLESVSIDSVKVDGEVRDLSIGQLQDHGIIWKVGNAVPTIFDNNGQTALGVRQPDKQPEFSATLRLKINQNYTLRAYATEDGQNFLYSDTLAYETGNGSVTTLSIDYQKSTTLDVSGQLTQTEKGLIAVQHGFCWSSSNAAPSLEDSSVDLGVRRNNNPFSYTLEGLNNEEVLYLRAYAILQVEFRRDTLYGESLRFDGNLNFWSRVADFTDITDLGGQGIFIDGHIYFIPYFRLFAGDTRKHFWKYDPLLDVWTQLPDYDIEVRDGETMISAADRGFIGLGSGQNSTILKDWWEYLPASGQWIRKTDYPGTSTELSFAIGSKIYLGSAGGSPGELWEYDPALDTWTEKTPFPGESRFNGTALGIDNKAYYGMGQFAGSSQTRLKEFWEYDPILDSWTQLEDFPGGARTATIGFAINGIGYFGMGNTTSQRVDLWAFDPATRQWTQKADFIGDSRSAPTAFATNTHGYVGLGRTNNTNGEIVYPTDFWRFNP